MSTFLEKILPGGFGPTSGTTPGGFGTTRPFAVMGITITAGAGAPTAAAPKGSFYSRTDGSSTSTRLYVNTDGGTTWTNVTTAA